MSTRKPKKPSQTTADPMAAREAQNYEFPVASRESILAHLTQRAEPLSWQRLAEEMGVDGERDQESFRRRLRAMERDGQLFKNRRGHYGLLQKMDMIRGRIEAHPDGFGFLTPEEGGDDLFVPPVEMRQVMHGDRVVARLAGLDHRGRQEAGIVEILERRYKTITGRYTVENRIALVVPADKRLHQDILIPPEEAGNAKNGQIVVAEISEYPTRRNQAVGRIIEVLGDHMAPGMEIQVAIRMHDLPHVWPAQVNDELAQLGPTVPETAKHGREDLRTLPLVTIDGEDARDFDDAVYGERVGRGFRLVVAIADVSSYVKPGTALDKEAYQRGNSVYFPNFVIPMLPEILSNGLCSINPQVDRLCMACEMHISGSGKIEKYRFFEAVMRSHARLTYNQVAAMLVQQDRALCEQFSGVLAHLQNLYALYQVLHKQRLARGAIDFELPETRIIYDSQRKIDRIEPLERNDAHKLIEECMLAANVCAGEFLSEHEMPALYRVHAGPSNEKLSALREFLFEMGLQLGGGESPQARDYAKLLSNVQGRPETRLVHTVLLRSLSQAVYSPNNLGHFALAYPCYTHFTSPIRRYPDLLVHRAIKQVLHKQASTDTGMQAHGDQLSMTERRADDATRDVIRWLKTEYMQDKIGEEFEAIISGVTNFGIFVELAKIYVDGLVHVTALGNDYYHFDAGKHRLVGERTRQVYRLGDPVKVKLVRVDLDEAKLDFELVAGPTGQRTAGRLGAETKPKRRVSRSKTKHGRKK